MICECICRCGTYFNNYDSFYYLRLLCISISVPLHCKLLTSKKGDQTPSEHVMNIGQMASLSMINLSMGIIENKYTRLSGQIYKSEARKLTFGELRKIVTNGCLVCFLLSMR